MARRFHNLELSEEGSVPAVGETLNRTGGFGADDYLTQATDAYRLSQYELALRMYTRCLERNRSCISAWVGQVQMLLQMGECHEARVWSDKALELFRDNGELLACKAQVCARLNDRRASFACSDGALQAPGSSPARWQARGEVLLAAGERHFDECFRKSLAEFAADWFDHVIIARIYLHYQRATNAMVYAKSAVKAEVDGVAAWLAMGHCQAALGLTAAARESYEHCLELRPDFAVATESIGALNSQSFVNWLMGLFRRRRP